MHLHQFTNRTLAHAIKKQNLDQPKELAIKI
jgi:hypothetical protein